MNAIAKRPAVRRAIGVPCNALGTLANANCSRIPANKTNANAKPIAVAIANNIPVNKPGSAPIGNLYVPLVLLKTFAMPSIIILKIRTTTVHIFWQALVKAENLW